MLAFIQSPDECEILTFVLSTLFLSPATLEACLAH